MCLCVCLFICLHRYTYILVWVSVFASIFTHHTQNMKVTCRSTGQLTANHRKLYTSVTHSPTYTHACIHKIICQGKKCKNNRNEYECVCVCMQIKIYSFIILSVFDFAFTNNFRLSIFIVNPFYCKVYILKMS